MRIETARQVWIDEHRELGHSPYPAPDSENPERWECKCDPDAIWTAVWRILTTKQVAQKFAHLKNRAPSAPQPCHYGDGTCLIHRRQTP